MGNFSDFINNDSYSKTENIKSEASKEDLQKIVDKYSGLSSDELMREFLRMTAEKKKNGELDHSELSNIKNTIMPYLDENQKAKLNSLINMVDNV